MNVLGIMETLMSQSRYLGINIGSSGKSNKQRSIDSGRTVSRSELGKDRKRRTAQGRNEPCNCGSGKKFKKCCGRVINEEVE